LNLFQLWNTANIMLGVVALIKAIGLQSGTILQGET